MTATAVFNPIQDARIVLFLARIIKRQNPSCINNCLLIFDETNMYQRDLQNTEGELAIFMAKTPVSCGCPPLQVR